MTSTPDAKKKGFGRRPQAAEQRRPLLFPRGAVARLRQRFSGPNGDFVRRSPSCRAQVAENLNDDIQCSLLVSASHHPGALRASLIGYDRGRRRGLCGYASEDRPIAEEIARELTELGIPTFFDRFSLRVGDSVIDSVTRGLASAKYGVVIVSPVSLQKSWPRQELKHLLRGHIEGRKRLLPVWHNVTPEDVARDQPALDDIWAIDTAGGLRAVVRALAAQIVGHTVAVVPAGQRPVQRFLDGEGELVLGFGGDAFTLWDALLSLPAETFPLYVEGEIIERDRAIACADEVLALRPGAAAHLDDADKESIRQMSRDNRATDSGEHEG